MAPASVVTDSVASLPLADAAGLGIEVVSLFVNDGERHEADVEIDLPAFYRRLADMKRLPTSSQPSVDSLVQAFQRAVQRGSDVVGVFISTKMSGTCETALLAAQMVKERFPAANIEIVDSGTNSMEEGFVALAAARAAEAGESLDHCVQAALDTARRTRYVFSPASLEYLRRGGRIGGASALVGQLLQIKPILTVEHGETNTFAKVRTQGRALAEMARVFAEDVATRGLERVVVHYIGDRAPADDFAAQHIEPIVGAPVPVVAVSAVIGLHVGPAVGLAYETTREPAVPTSSARRLLMDRS